MKYYWFYIDTYVYARKTENSLILYNTLSKNITKFYQIEILSFYDKLKEENGIIKLNTNDLKNRTLREFVILVKNTFSGDLIEIKNGNSKPILLKSQCHIMDDARNKAKDEKKEIKDILQYLHELSIYVNSECNIKDCQICNYAYKQTDTCYKQAENNSLNLEEIKPIIDLIDCLPNLRKLKVLGGDINKYESLNDLLELLKEKQTEIEFIFNIKQLKKETLSKFKNKNFTKKIIIQGRDGFQIFKKNIDFLKKDDCSFDFLVDNEIDFDLIDKNYHLLNGINHRVVPIYLGNNLLFFEQNVYMTEEDIVESQPELKSILRNEKLNTNFFGKLFITSKGDVYENLNGTSIASIKKINLAKLISQIITNGDYWFKIRQNCNECKDCHFVDICPPISNYELVLKQNNLCKVQV